MLTKSYATILLANAIASCYLEGNVRKPLPFGTTASEVRSVINKLTFTSNNTKEVFALLVDACEHDYDFNSFMLMVFNCEAIPENSDKHKVAADYLVERGLLCEK